MKADDGYTAFFGGLHSSSRFRFRRLTDQEFAFLTERVVPAQI
jgi:hypothetical protein